MPSHQPNLKPNLESVDGLLLRPVDPEVVRVAHLCCPVFHARGPAAFRPSCFPAVAEWKEWMEAMFAPHILPAFRSALRHGLREHSGEVRTADERLDSHFSCQASRLGSRAAGRKLLADFRPPFRARTIERLRAWAAADAIPGHFAIVFAARCAVFQIPASLAVSGYLFQEWLMATGEEFGLPALPAFCNSTETPAIVRSAGTPEEEVAALT